MLSVGMISIMINGSYLTTVGKLGNKYPGLYNVSWEGRIVIIVNGYNK